MRKKDIRYTLAKWLFCPSVALITFAITEFLARNPHITEKYYSGGLYPNIASLLSRISSVFQFSLDDAFYVILILLFISLIILSLFRKIAWKTTGRIVLNIAAISYVLFYFLWGFNYFRQDLNTRLILQERKPETKEYVTVLEDMVKQTNESYDSFKNFGKQEIDSLIENAYKNLATGLLLKYPAGKRKAKKITFSRFFARAGISGYYGPFFNEVHVNKYNLPIEYPFVLAHEKAHQFGVTGEAEANFYAWLVCKQSDSKMLHYSANLVALRYFIYQGTQLEELPELVKKLNEPVKKDLQKIREHWAELRDKKVDQVASKVNDAYLKTNKVEKGIDDYTGIVKYIMDFSYDYSFQERNNLQSANKSYF